MKRDDNNNMHKDPTNTAMHIFLGIGLFCTSLIAALSTETWNSFWQTLQQQFYKHGIVWIQWYDLDRLCVNRFWGISSKLGINKAKPYKLLSGCLPISCQVWQESSHNFTAGYKIQSCIIQDSGIIHLASLFPESGTFFYIYIYIYNKDHESANQI